MNPSNKEMQLRKTCQLYAYVLASQGQEVPEEIHECTDSYDYLVDCTAKLSQLLKELDSDTFNRVVYDTDSKEARDLAHWWDMNQEADRLCKTLVSTCL